MKNRILSFLEIASPFRIQSNWLDKFPNLKIPSTFTNSNGKKAYPPLRFFQKVAKNASLKESTNLTWTPTSALSLTCHPLHRLFRTSNSTQLSTCCSMPMSTPLILHKRDKRPFRWPLRFLPSQVHRIHRRIIFSVATWFCTSTYFI